MADGLCGVKLLTGPKLYKDRIGRIHRVRAGGMLSGLNDMERRGDVRRVVRGPEKDPRRRFGKLIRSTVLVRRITAAASHRFPQEGTLRKLGGRVVPQRINRDYEVFGPR